MQNTLLVILIVLPLTGLANICDRPQEIMERILLQLKMTDCSKVTDQQLSKVKRLFLNYYLDELPLNSFKGLTGLDSLDIYTPNTKSISPEAFADLGKLTELRLVGVSSLEIDSQLLKYLPELKQIYISNFKLKEIPKGFLLTKKNWSR